MTFVRIFRSFNFAGSVFALRIKRACPTKIVISKFHKKVIYNMKTAYFHHNEGEDKVYVTVNFSELNKKRAIHFERNILETMTDFLERVDARIKKLYSKLLMKNEELESTPEVKSLLLFNNEPFFDRILFQDIFQNNDFEGNLKLRILESDYTVLINCPLITNMDLPKVLFVGCYIQPENIKTQSADYLLADYTWYKNTRLASSQSGWEKCGEGYFYKIKEDDIKKYLKVSCTPKMNGKVGPNFEVISEVPVVECSNLSVIAGRQELTKEKTGPNEFRIVTYNILADFYLNTKEAKNSIFTFCDPSCLDPEYRETLLNFELEGYNADIMCLQEVEKKLFIKNKVLFHNWGYESSYSGKGGREGSAILFKKDKFNLIHSQQYTFTKELLINPLFNDIKLKIENNIKLIERLKHVVSQIQVTVLDSVSDNVLVIGNVHLYFHPDACHIRLLQGIESMRLLLNTVEEVKKMKPNKKVSVLLCGDFNSTPDRGFHKLLTTGSVDDSEPCWTSNIDEAIKGISCAQPWKMKSCYDDKILTNYIPTFKACIDYIYFQTDHLELKQTVPTPSEEVLSQFSGIPSFYFPSDHVALIADLKFKDSD